MTPQDEERIRVAAKKVAARWPPLTQDQINRVSLLLRDYFPSRAADRKAA